MIQNMKFRYLMISVCFLVGCGSGILDVQSSKFSTARKRIAFLRKRMVMFSEIQDTIFDLYDVNGKFSLGIPGPSHWDFKVIMRVKQHDLPKWVDGFEQIHNPEEELLQWGYKLLQGQPGWTVRSTPSVYERPNETEGEVIVAIFEEEEIVFKRIHHW